MLEYTVQNQENYHTVIDVTIPAQEIKPKLDENFKRVQQSVKLEGFRKGKVPAQLVRKMFGKQIEQDTFQPFISEAYETITKENEFQLLSMPNIENVNFDESAGLTFSITFDEQPDFTIEDYKNLPVERVTYMVDDEDVQDTLKHLQNQNAMIHTVEGEAEPGHILVADLQEIDDQGVPILGKKFENQPVWLKEEDEDLTPQLTGVKTDEERKITLKTPTPASESEDVPDEPDKHYLVTVKEIKERRVPDLDDEFAKDLGDFETLDELTRGIEENIQREAQSRTDYEFKKALQDELIKRTGVQVPASLLHKYLDAVVEDARKKQKNEVDEERIRQEYQDLAAHQIQWMLLREQLIKQLEPHISDEEVKAHLEAEKEAGRLTDDQIEALNADEKRLNDIKDNLVEEKVYDILKEHADITELEKPLREADQDKGTESES